MDTNFVKHEELIDESSSILTITEREDLKIIKNEKSNFYLVIIFILVFVIYLLRKKLKIFGDRLISKEKGKLNFLSVFGGIIVLFVSLFESTNYNRATFKNVKANIKSITSIILGGNKKHTKKKISNSKSKSNSIELQGKDDINTSVNDESESFCVENLFKINEENEIKNEIDLVVTN